MESHWKVMEIHFQGFMGTLPMKVRQMKKAGPPGRKKIQTNNQPTKLDKVTELEKVIEINEWDDIRIKKLDELDITLNKLDNSKEENSKLITISKKLKKELARQRELIKTLEKNSTKGR